MVEDTRYQRRLLEDLRTPRLKPSTECMLWAFAIGRPVEDEDDEPRLKWFDQHIS